MTEHGNMVLRLAYFYLRDRHRAEDVAQEVFLRAYRHWHRFRGASDVKTWLYRITVNCCRDWQRTRASQERPMEVTPPAAPAPNDVQEEALAQLDRTVVLEHMMQLPAPYREALFFFYYCDLDTREMAETLGCREGTVRSRLHRARQALKDRLEKGGFEREASR